MKRSAPWLSMNNIVGWCCAYPPNLCRMDLRCKIVFPVSADAVNLAYVDESATFARNFDLYTIKPPANVGAIQVMGR